MTGQETTQLTERPRRRFQFSLGGLMVLVFGVAVGFSIASMKGLGFADGILAAAGAWIVLGLVNQARDLWSTHLGRKDLSRDERWGWRLAVFWRAGVACLLVGYYLVSALVALQVIDLPESDDALGATGSDVRRAIFLVCMLIVLYSVLPARPAGRRGLRARVLDLAGVALGLVVCAMICWERMTMQFLLVCMLIVLYSVLPARPAGRRGLRARVLDLAGVALGLVVCAMICWERMTLQFLVAVAIQGIEMAQPLRFAPEGVDLFPAARTARFFRECSLALPLTLINLGLTYGLATQWSRGLGRRLAWSALLVIALPISACYSIWVCTVAMPRAFPIMIEAQKHVPLHVWVSALLLILVLTTATTYRLVGSAPQPSGGTDLTWRRADGRYYHERRAVILLLAFGIVAKVVAVVWHVAREFSSLGLRLGWPALATECLCNGQLLLPLIVLSVAGYAVLRLGRGGLARRACCPTPLSASHFGAVWLALFLTAAVGIPMIAIFSFAIWFSPWYRMSWP